MSIFDTCSVEETLPDQQEALIKYCKYNFGMCLWGRVDIK